jgi:hypothetical protein
MLTRIALLMWQYSVLKSRKLAGNVNRELDILQVLHVLGQFMSGALILKN